MTCVVTCSTVRMVCAWARHCWVLVVVGVLGLFGARSYNKLVGLDQAVQAQWSQVENVYQRRADLVPNLVETVKGAAKFEKDTFTAVTEARAKVGQVQQGDTSPNDPAAVQKFRERRISCRRRCRGCWWLSSAIPISRRRRHSAICRFSSEGTENRIAVERMRFVQAAQAFNSARNTFPTNIIAGVFGSRFAEKAYFKAQAGAETAPKVQF